MAEDRGRPSIYSQELADRICAALAEGRTLRDVCRDEGMPTEATVRNWALVEDEEKRPGFFSQYARAREIGYHAMADETLEISDDGTNDWMKRTQGEDTIDVVNNEAIARSRLRVDTRKWLLSKALPKIYGDKVTSVIEGGEKPVEITGDTRADARRVAMLLAKGVQKAE